MQTFVLRAGKAVGRERVAGMRFAAEGGALRVEGDREWLRELGGGLVLLRDGAPAAVAGRYQVALRPSFVCPPAPAEAEVTYAPIAPAAAQ